MFMCISTAQARANSATLGCPTLGPRHFSYTSIYLLFFAAVLVGKGHAFIYMMCGCEAFGLLGHVSLYKTKGSRMPNIMFKRGVQFFLWRVYFFKDIFILFLRIFCFLASGSFPCYLLHFGANISDLHAFCCILELKSLICFWLLAFGFWLGLVL